MNIQVGSIIIDIPIRLKEFIRKERRNMKRNTEKNIEIYGYIGLK